MSTRKFRPTYLCIKRHSITGKLYFCKSMLDYEGMIAYLGSGTVWKRHIIKHGIEHVETVWFCLFTEKEECKKFALSFSEKQQIVEAKDPITNKKIWANLRPENGLNGGSAKGEGKGRKQSKETCNKRAKSIMGNTNGKGGPGFTGKHTEEFKKNQSILRTGTKQSAKTIAKKIEKQTGQKRTEETKKNMGKPKSSKVNYFGPKERVKCPYCPVVGGVNIMPRYHFDNCKHKVI